MVKDGLISNYPIYGDHLEITNPIYSHALDYEEWWTEQSMTIHNPQGTKEWYKQWN